MAFSAIDLSAVLVGDDLCHRERYPHAVIKGLSGEDDAVFKALEAQCIFQIFVYIEQIAVVNHQIQLVPRSILDYEVIDDFKAFSLIGNGVRDVFVHIVEKREKKALGIGISLLYGRIAVVMSAVEDSAVVDKSPLSA